MKWIIFLTLLLGWHIVISAFGEPLIVFESKRAGNYDIYLLDLATGEERRLTDSPAYDGQPFWSPDGQKIVFISTRDGNREIYVMDADGKNQRNLANSPGVDLRTGIDWKPSWSPDGKQIAFASFRSGNEEIYLMNPDGTNLRKLTSSHAPFYSSQPVWSPDGQKIAFSSSRNGNWDIYLMNANGSEMRNLTNHSSEDKYPAWSPDGRKIAFVSWRCCGDWPSLFVQEIESGRVKRIPVPFNSPQYPSWTPDSRKIIFNDNHPESQLYIVDIETEKTKTVVNKFMPGFNSHPRWFDPDFVFAVSAVGKQKTTWGWFKQNSSYK